MKVKIKRIDQGLPLPVYETNGAVGFDLIVRENTVVAPGQIALIPANVVIEVPKGYALLIVARSSMPRKHGLTKPHGIGIIDQDYCGPEDEIKIQVQNFRNEPVTVKRGDRIAQGLFVRTEKPEFKEVDEIRAKSRGGFGSTH